ncbi:hypothetical protein COOONC_07142 [Cooperia oncophora]
MVIRHVWLLPVIAVALTLAGMLSGYIIGVLTKHLPPLVTVYKVGAFSQIWVRKSVDGGYYPPEGCIFAQFLNMASFFIVITVYVRHRQTVEYYGHRLHWEKTAWRWMSLALMYIGITSAIGITIVANFPESEVPKVHLFGAALTFISLMIYGWGQVIIGYAMVPRMASMWVNHLRLVIMLIATPCFLLHELAASFKIFVPKGAGIPPGGWIGIKRPKPDSPLYLNYIVSTSSEWALAFAMLMFVLTLTAELRYAYAHAPRVIFRRSPQDCPDLGELRTLQKSALIPAPISLSSSESTLKNYLTFHESDTLSPIQI